VITRPVGGYHNKECFMKNIVKVFGIIALAAVIGFAMAGCSNSTSGGSDPRYTVYTKEGFNTAYWTNLFDNPVLTSTGIKYGKTTTKQLALSACSPSGLTNQGSRTWSQIKTDFQNVGINSVAIEEFKAGLDADGFKVAAFHDGSEISVMAVFSN
jgi:hypothetical protein